MIVNAIEFMMMNNPLRAFIQEHYEIKQFIPFVKKVKDGKVLEVGCGNGFGASLIDQRFHPEAITGIDLDQKMIDRAKKNYPRYSFEVGDVTDLRFPDNSFDSIFDFGVLHHIPNWQVALKELFRVLKPNGHIFIEDLSIESFRGIIGGTVKKLTDHPYHDMYKQKDFIKYISQAGFKIIKQESRRPVNTMCYFVLIATK